MASCIVPTMMMLPFGCFQFSSLSELSDASSISVVQGDVAELLFDIETNIVLGWCSESVALLCKDLHDILCEITASDIQCKMACGRT